MKTNLTKTFKRSVTAVAVAMTLSATMPAMADNSSGSVFGHVATGTSVKIKSLDTGMQREVVADNGSFAFKLLPTGRYEVTANGVKRVIVVKLGTGSSVSFDDMEVIQVQGSTISTIDVSSVESSTVFTAEQMQALPIGRDITNVALLAPGTVQGDDGFGNLASFGGSSVAENGYYINGFDVTNLRTLLSFAELPFDAIGQQQVKTGGYGAEYGRSLGGVLNVVTKRGTNEWKFGGAAYVEPQSLRSDRTDSLNKDPDTIALGEKYYTFGSANESDRLSYNIYGGGPIIEDTLFVWGMIDGRKNETETYGRTTSRSTVSAAPQYTIKLDWNITDDHLLELTAIDNTTEVDYTDYDSATPFSTTHDGTPTDYTIENGGKVTIAKYTGYLTDDLNMSVLYGKMESFDSYKTPEVLPGGDCPRVYDSREGGIEYLGCWSTSQVTIRDPDFGPDEDVRTGIRVDFEYDFGDHAIRFGWDTEDFDSASAGWVYSGGQYNRYFTSNGTVNGEAVPEGTEYVRTWDRGASSGIFRVENEAFYIEDNWTVTDNFMLYLGLRSESFTNYNSDDAAFVAADNLVAPRLGFSWDLDGDSSKKFFGTLGRYYIPVASNTNIRAAGSEFFDITYNYFTAIDPTSSAPTKAAQIGPVQTVSNGEAANPATIAATNLNPMYQDELILGYQQALEGDFENWTVGIKTVLREVGDGMDDYCSYQGFIDWAEDEGHTEFDYHNLAGCMIINPGNDLEIDVALDGAKPEELTNVTIGKEYLGMPKYQRKYKSIELSFERANTDGFYVQGSYTWAKSEGNTEGYVNSSLEQGDPGLTQDWDHALFTDGTYGDLPNARQHSFKAFGLYEINDEMTVSANMNLTSGRPVNCQGYLPLGPEQGVDEGGLSGYGASSFYCVDQNGDKKLTNRGDFGETPWTFKLDLGFSYVPDWADKKLSLRIDVINAFNNQKPVDFNETGEKGESSSPDYNPNFRNVNAYQTPRYARFTARYNF
jgi:hypothetical protein